MRGDIRVIGLAQSLPRRIAASATRYEVGEPLLGASMTLSSGVASANVFTLAAIDFQVLNVDTFGGIAITHPKPFGTGTLVAHTAMSANPIPGVGRLRARAETPTSVDTDAEILLLINDVVLFDYDATGASDSGELYTIKEVASADTSAFQIVEGNPAKQTLDVMCDPRVYRIDNDITT